MVTRGATVRKRAQDGQVSGRRVIRETRTKNKDARKGYQVDLHKRQRHRERDKKVNFIVNAMVSERVDVNVSKTARCNIG